MPLYYFHLRDGEDTIIDAEGMELGGFEQVKKAALEAARNIISHEALKGQINLKQRIDVVDQAGSAVHSVDFADAVVVRS